MLDSAPIALADADVANAELALRRSYASPVRPRPSPLVCSGGRTPETSNQG
ncbi:hypothetical protein K6Y31_20165 [Motilimonas cestriensis]|uniref:Uncharacterized protein n=1 Tax=Motilimonas cestriensis TaxID=2742685 RepID=A0ABS8WH83_9GAMM|nr:hypothetical protein [Motilimonas cestriensis]MCE2597093.1 hypothetical protein [Motilimonas cestriensis]